MIKDTLTAVKEALKTVPDLRYTAEDWGQLDFFNQPPVRFPCVLLDAEEVRYSDSGRGFQQGEASLTVRVADNRVFNGSFQAPASQAEFAMFDLLQAVYQALQGVRARRDDGIREFRMSFDFAFTDADAAKKR